MLSYLTFTISPEQEGLTVEQLLREQGFSKNAVSRLKNAACSFSIAQRRVNSNHILHAGDILTVPISNQSAPHCAIEPWEMPLSLVYEDEYFLVTDKPSGMPMYPHHQGGNGSLANILASHYPKQTFHALNRLDANTAGLVVIAKNAYILHQLQKAEVSKYYLLYAEGFLAGEGIIDLPLVHLNGQPRVLIDPKGKEARTAYKVLKSGSAKSLVWVQLLTGRTHQIRAHFSALGHPLWGDRLYGSSHGEGYRLLAYHLHFNHPMSGKLLEFESPQALCF